MATSRSKTDNGKQGRTRPRQSPELETSSSPTVDSDMLRSIKLMMDEMRGVMVTDLGNIITDTVKKEMSTQLKPLEDKLNKLCDTIADLEQAANEHDGRIASMEGAVQKLTAVVETLTKRCEDLEARSRRNNIRVVGLPEGAEGSRPVEFMASFLKGLLGMDAEPVLDLAHRAPRAKPKDGEPPRPVIIRVHRFQTRNVILRTAGNLSPLTHQGKRISIFPDFTTAVAKKRASFGKVKEQLRSCSGVKFGIRYPATLLITPKDGKTRSFDDPDQAMDFVTKTFKTSETD